VPFRLPPIAVTAMLAARPTAAQDDRFEARLYAQAGPLAYG
jgi:hypothetical protein